jgi:hypothetical protein
MVSKIASREKDFQSRHQTQQRPINDGSDNRMIANVNKFGPREEEEIGGDEQTSSKRVTESKKKKSRARTRAKITDANPPCSLSFPPCITQLSRLTSYQHLPCHSEYQSDDPES